MIITIAEFYSLRADGFVGFEWVFIVGGKDLFLGSLSVISVE